MADDDIVATRVPTTLAGLAAHRAAIAAHESIKAMIAGDAELVHVAVVVLLDKQPPEETNFAIALGDAADDPDCQSYREVFAMVTAAAQQLGEQLNLTVHVTSKGGD